MADRQGDFSALEREIRDLHRFFQDWYNGAIPDTDESFQRFAGALAPGFLIVLPDGRALDREQILRAVRTENASHGKSGPEIRIWVEDVRLRIPPRTDGDLLIATYEEWQGDAGDDDSPRGRLSTGVFRIPPAPGTAPGTTPGTAPGTDVVEWLHVHETWLPSSIRPKGDGEDG
ncbi:MAG: hypothetical protein EA376_05005 [Phycisphaeraceae bacterium]|nr:MAG: hypothetical protein EA376_05005 [Phycisphaeraceae bacterium]